MKKSALVEEAHIHDEPESHTSKSALPKLTYRSALASFFLTGSRAIRSIRACSPDEMSDLVEACIPSASSPNACAHALKGLDYSQLLDRWYALDTLRVYSATVPLYASAEDAHAIDGSRAELLEVTQ